MGKRKTVRYRKPYKQINLPEEFDCPFCNYPNCLEVFMNHGKGEARIKCRVCGASYRNQILPIMKKADVYCMWLDECEKVNQQVLAKTNRLDDFLSDSDEEQENKENKHKIEEKSGESFQEKGREDSESVKIESMVGKKRPFKDGLEETSVSGEKHPERKKDLASKAPKRRGLKRIKDIKFKMKKDNKKYSNL